MRGGSRPTSPAGLDWLQVNHLELSPEQIREYKKSWEAFVNEARQPFPKVVATLTAYGTKELVHSLQLVMQWPA